MKLIDLLEVYGGTRINLYDYAHYNTEKNFIGSYRTITIEDNMELQDYFECNVVAITPEEKTFVRVLIDVESKDE